MTDWTPLRVTLSILEVEGDDKYFDPGRWVALVKLNSGANFQLDLGDPENSGSVHLKEQFDTLRITVKDKSKGTVYGSVSFDVETFRDHPVTKQWISLHSSSLSDAFKGEIGKDQRHTPRILLGYDAIPHSGEENRGRTTSKRTKETSQLERGSDDSRRKKSARDKQRAGGNLIIKSLMEGSRSRIINPKETSVTKVTKVERQGSGSNRGSKAEPSRFSSSFTKRVGKGISASPQFTRSSGIRSLLVGGFEHGEVEKDIGNKTNNIVADFHRETGAIAAEENRILKKLELWEESNAKLDQDEKVLKLLRDKAAKDLDNIKLEARTIQKDEENKQRELIGELETLEQELEDIENQLRDEEAINRQTGGGQLTIGGIELRDEQEINAIKQETELVLSEIRDAIKRNQITADESSFDPLFREDLDNHAKDLIEKRKTKTWNSAWHYWNGRR